MKSAKWGQGSLFTFSDVPKMVLVYLGNVSTQDVSEVSQQKGIKPADLPCLQVGGILKFSDRDDLVVEYRGNKTFASIANPLVSTKKKQVTKKRKAKEAVEEEEEEESVTESESDNEESDNEASDNESDSEPTPKKKKSKKSHKTSHKAA